MPRPKGAVERYAGLGSALTSLGSALAGLMFVWSMVRPFLPRTVFKYYLGHLMRQHARWLVALLDPWLTITITDHDGGGRHGIGAVYDRAKAYLSAQCATRARSLRAELAARGSERFLLSMDHNEEIADDFQGATVWWHSVSLGGPVPRRSYRLVFHERHRDLIVQSYLPHVSREGRAIMASTRRQKLFTNTFDRHNSSWSYVVFEHPSTFDTLAMDPAKKRAIMDDLDAFRNGRDYYARIGKAWKRGYLLYGPPGTGKSTMIAAMANYLDYDVYNIELTSVTTNAELQRLFVETKGKSIIVVEDIDCSAEFTGKRDRKKPPPPGPDDYEEARKVTLSGLLNAIDGLWSACGGERIIIFTTNHVEKLDPALIRRGRMDKHIEMSYCCFEAFRFLARNYHGIDAHPLFDDIEALLDEAEITPADVAEHLMPKCAADDADSCLASLVKALVEKAKENATTAVINSIDDLLKDDETVLDK
ncbi:AAA-ATPase At3g28580 [Lolium perenne]|uniref:AAA-ATPase At3g28580 n=1 Tax=Lolium perenne TaxID=4522 RepID=UPI0021EA74F0|nr:AAA-ATPase At3g28580-like [Lolium perenne]